MTSEME